MTFPIRLFAPLRVLLDTVNNHSYRASILEAVTPLIDGGSRILDVGCGDGSLPDDLMRQNPTLQIVGVDVQHRRPCRIPRATYDGHNLPFPDRSFDLVMAIDVLHHTRAMLPVLREMIRVSRRYLLIKDHVWDGNIITWLGVGLCDWLTNAPYGIGCAFNYLTEKGWTECFDSLGLYQNAARHVSHFPFKLNERFNCVFLLEKPQSRVPFPGAEN